MADEIVNLYDCDVCSFRYDPKDFTDVDLDGQPDSFECPNCQAGKDHFHVFTPPSDDVAPLLDGDEDQSSGPPDPTGPRLMYTKSGTPNLDSLHGQFLKRKLDTQPDFQRYEVWSTQKKSALIESVLLDLPIPQVFLAEESEGTSVVIDGQQRLMAVFRYLSGEYSLKGVNKSIEDKVFSDLPEKLQQKIENYELHVVKILPESDPEVRFTLFQRLNEGSISLNDQELRNCVWRGSYNEFVKELSEESLWRKSLNLKKRHPRMTDVELVLRYMAFRDQTYMKHPDKKTGKFLDKQMRLGADYRAKDITAAKKDFKTAIELAQTVFGDHAFRRFVAGDEMDRTGSWDSRTNRALMDVQLWGFNRYAKGLYVKNADALRDASIDLMSKPEFSDLISHTISEFKRLERRFDLWKQMIDLVLGDSDQGPRLFGRKAKEAAFKTDPTCSECGQKIQSIDDAHMDHVEAYSKGGSTVPANGAITHRYCNLSKSAG